MRKLYETCEWGFALLWIVLYVAIGTAGNALSRAIGIEMLAETVVYATLTVVLLRFFRRNGLMRKYGLCGLRVPARKFLWFVPLAIVCTENLWLGPTVNLPLWPMIVYMAGMLFVGVLEELLFRGLLFCALKEENVRIAYIVSSFTFGLGHFVNLLNGADLFATICQIAAAIPIGFLFVLIFDRGGSLIPCIIAHCIIDIVSVFANEAALTPKLRLILTAVVIGIVVSYTLFLYRTQGADDVAPCIMKK